ncbi:hypothetical protein [Actinoplanes sp. NPDC049681]|uniref:hypothetical protein n=1 Tax=Actinoplanes sp. NPDC049681 TaxID=3363905 RepID=UPI0037B0BAFF
MRVISHGRRDTIGGILAAIAVVGALAVLIAEPGRTPVLAPRTIAVATVVAVCCGAVLAWVIMLLSGRTASVGQWLRRTSAGVALLTPFVVYVTWPFYAPGWDVDWCGALIARNRQVEASNPGLGRQCRLAAHDRLWEVVVWAAIACAAAVGYGLWLRWRGKVREPEWPLVA